MSHERDAQAQPEDRAIARTPSNANAQSTEPSRGAALKPALRQLGAAGGYQAQAAFLTPGAVQADGGAVQGGQDAQAIAQAGVRGGGGALPHAGAIQASFGRFDVGGVRAHVGGAAADASKQLGANAYATGDAVGFAGAPSLHTAAHEAAHVVQQRAGVQLEGGVGAEGDAYERHADAVADRVVAGASAEELLASAPGGGGAGPAVQREAAPGAGPVVGTVYTLDGDCQWRFEADGGWTFLRDGKAVQTFRPGSETCATVGAQYEKKHGGVVPAAAPTQAPEASAGSEAPEASAGSEAPAAAEAGSEAAPVAAPPGGVIEHARCVDANAYLREGPPSGARDAQRRNVPQGRYVTWLGTARTKAGELAHVLYREGGEVIDGWSGTGNFAGRGPLPAEEWARLSKAEAPPLTTAEITARVQAPDAAEQEDDAQIRADRDARRAAGETGGGVGALSTTPAGFLTVGADAGRVGVHEGPSGGARVGEVAAGDHVAMTGSRQEVGGATWVEVDLGDGRLGWLDAAATNAAEVLGEVAAAAEAEAARETARQEAELYSEIVAPEPEQVAAAPAGLKARAHLVVAGDGTAPVYDGLLSERTLGQLPAAAGEARHWELVAEIGPGDGERREVLFGGRPGFVARAAMREATPVDVMMNAQVLAEDEVPAARAALAAMTDEPARREAYMLRLQAMAPGLGREDQASFSHGGRGAPMTQLAACLAFLGVPNPYPDQPFADALEMVRLERGLSPAMDVAGWAALVTQLGVGCQALGDASPAALKGHLATGASVMLTVGGVWARVRGVGEDGAVQVDGLGGGTSVAPAGALAGAQGCVFAVPTEAALDPTLLETDVALDAATASAGYDEMYAATSAAESDWYEKKRGDAELAGHVPEAGSPLAFAGAPADKIEQAFERVMGPPGADVRAGFARGAGFLGPLFAVAEPAEALVEGREAARERLRGWLRDAVAKAVEGPGGVAEAGAAVQWLEASGAIGGEPVVTEATRDVLRAALVPMKGEGEEAAAEGPVELPTQTRAQLEQRLAGVDLKAVLAVPVEAVYTGEHLGAMRQALEQPEVKALWAAAGAAYAARMKVVDQQANTGVVASFWSALGYDAGTTQVEGYGELPAALRSSDAMTQAWNIKRLADEARWGEVSAACDALFVGLEGAIGHERGAGAGHDASAALAEFKGAETFAPGGEGSRVRTLDFAQLKYEQELGQTENVAAQVARGVAPGDIQGTQYKWSEEAAAAQIAGDKDAYQFWCSGFAIWTLASAGYDLTKEIKGKDGKVHGYLEAGKKTPKALTMQGLVDGWNEMVGTMSLITNPRDGIVNEHTGQPHVAPPKGKPLTEIDGVVVRIEHTEVTVSGKKQKTATSGHVDQRNYVQGEEIDPTQDSDAVKGAVAAFVATGVGYEVPFDEQKPGDFAQSRAWEAAPELPGGGYTGKGHAYQIYSVTAVGTANFGKPGQGSPELVTPGKDLGDGWQEGAVFEITMHTDPALVRDTTFKSRKVIDSNTGGGKGGDAGVYVRESKTTAAVEKGTTRHYTGRLYESPWANRATAAAKDE